VDPFLSIDDFADEFGRALTDAETLVATRLLQVISDWIRGQKVDVDVTAAAQVVWEVVRDAVNYGEFERLSSFSNTTADRVEAGVFDRERQLVQAVIADYVTNRHKRLLGIQLRASPVGSFAVDDFNPPTWFWS
jgi:hypothetical protein